MCHKKQNVQLKQPHPLIKPHNDFIESLFYLQQRSSIIPPQMSLNLKLANANDKFTCVDKYHLVCFKKSLKFQANHLLYVS